MHAFLASLLLALPLAAAEPPKLADTFAMKNLVAWCIVPFDSQKRTPKQRVEMLQRLGFTQFAYDWRAEHLPSFPEEIELLKKSKISLKGVWFPASVGKDGEFILDALKKADVKTELWVMLLQPKAESQEEKVKETAKLVSDLAKRAAKQGCKIGIYNHGGWTGEPENMVAVAKACGEPNVGIVYNLHHGHSHLTKDQNGFLRIDFLNALKPYLFCMNLNGMDAEGEKNGNKLLVIGGGREDNALMLQIRESGFAGPFGILGHTNDDAEDRLHDNLAGLDHYHGYFKHPKQYYPPAFRTKSGKTWNIRLIREKPESPLIFEFSNFDKEGAYKLVPKELDESKIPKHFKVVVRDTSKPLEDDRNKAAVAGKYIVKSDAVCFEPRFPLEPGLTYQAVVYRRDLIPRMFDGWPDYGYYATFTIPNATQEKPTTVDAVYPTSSKLPENALRMYLHFSAPMKQGLGQKYIRLECDGKTVLDPYLHIEQELWSADGKRLTILFDPARVKRGLKPREEAGPILVEGKKHTLTIDAAWPDALGFPLKEKFTYSFEVGPPDETPIDPVKWTITPPTKGTQLVVKFEKPLDKALSERLIWVIDATGKRIELQSLANKDQTGVTLGTTATAWKPGKYKLVIDTRLEDVCGNRVGEAFEVDEFQPVTSAVIAKTVEREFTVK